MFGRHCCVLVSRAGTARLVDSGPCPFHMFNGHWGHPRDPSPAVRSGRDSGWTTPNSSTPGPMFSSTVQLRQGRGRELNGQANYSTLIQPELISTQQLQIAPSLMQNLQLQYSPQQQQQQHQIKYSQSALIVPDYQFQDVPQISQVQLYQGVQLVQDVIQPVFYQQQPIQVQEVQEFVYVQDAPRAVSPKPMRAPPLRERAVPSPPPPPPENGRYRERGAPPPPPSEPETKYVDRYNHSFDNDDVIATQNICIHEQIRGDSGRACCL